MDAIVESLENAIQITVLLLCMILAFVRMHSVREKSWLLLMSFYGSFLLGDLYWQVCLFCLGTIPEVSIVSDLSWYASYLFLFLLLCIPGKQKGSVAGIPADSKMRLIPYLAPVFTGAMAVFYMGSGKIITNIVYAALMGLLLFTASKGLLQRKEGSFRPLYRAVFVFCLLEYALWTASCFWEYTACRYLYFCIDLCITMCFPRFFRIVREELQP